MRVDIPADLNSEDETGFVWTFLDEASDPETIRPGELVIAGSELTPAVCEVVDLVDKAVGTVVHLRVLPESIPLPAPACTIAPSGDSSAETPQAP